MAAEDVVKSIILAQQDTSIVYLDVLSSGELRARKEISCPSDNPEYANSPIDIFSAFSKFYSAREGCIQRHLSHPCIAQEYSFKTDEIAKKVILTMDFIPGGTLFSFLRLNPPCEHFTRAKEYILIYALAATIEYIHDKNVVYRDLKPLNVMLDERLLPVLIDFGHARFVGDQPEEANIPGRDDMLTFGLGTKQYNPPELLDEKSFDKYYCYGSDIELAKKIDVYMFGMVVYEILTHKMPFQGSPENVVARDILQGRRPVLEEITHFHSLTETVLKPAWAADPNERPSMFDIVETIKFDAQDNLYEPDLQEFEAFLSTWKSLESTAHGTKENLKRCADFGIDTAKSIWDQIQ